MIVILLWTTPRLSQIWKSADPSRVWSRAADALSYNLPQRVKTTVTACASSLQQVHCILQHRSNSATLKIMPFYGPLSRASTMGRRGPIDCRIRVGKPSMIGSVSSVNAAINGIFGRMYRLAAASAILQSIYAKQSASLLERLGYYIPAARNPCSFHSAQ